MPRVVLKDFNLGGMADSILQGRPNSLYRIVGCDLHSKPGTLQLSQKLKKESGATITTLCKNVVHCSNGETYYFSSTTGEIWARNSSGTFRAVLTTVPTSGGVSCLGAAEHQGFIVWATESYVHRVAVANATDSTWSTGLTQNWQAFTATDDTYHPMKVVNLNLYIGDGKYVAEWDGSTWTATKLDVNDPHRVSGLGVTPEGYQLLIGTKISSTVQHCRVYRWNTWSGTTFQADDIVYENGINCFLPFDNASVIQAGTKGNLYQFIGDRWELWGRIPGDWDTGNEAIVYADAAANLGGNVLMGVSKVNTDDPILTGVYEIGKYDPKYPAVIHLKHVISTTNSVKTIIGAIELIGDKPVVAWQDDTPGTKGADIIDTQNRTSIGFIETRRLDAERDFLKEVMMKVGLPSRPSGTGVTISSDKGAGLSSSNFIYDDTRKLAEIQEIVADAPFAHFKIELVAPQDNSNNTPEIDQILIDY